MGTSDTTSNLANADYIAIWNIVVTFIGIIVNSLLAYWIVNNIQKKQQTERVVKDVLIEDLKKIKDDYHTCLTKLYSGQVSPKHIISWFKVMNIKTGDNMKVIYNLYGIDMYTLNPYQNEIREIITNCPEFNHQFHAPLLSLSTETKASILRFQQENNHLFMDLILKIHSA